MVIEVGARELRIEEFGDVGYEECLGSGNRGADLLGVISFGGKWRGDVGTYNSNIQLNGCRNPHGI